MATPVYGGTASYSSNVHNGANPKTVACGTRAVGDLVVYLPQQITGNGTPTTFTVTDNLGNTYTQAATQRGADNRQVDIWYSIITTGGNLTVSCASSVATANAGQAVWYTPAPGTTIQFDTAGSYGTNVNSLTWYLADVGGLSTSPDVCLIGTACNNGGQTPTGPSGFTARQTVLTNRGFTWTRESTSPITADRFGFTVPVTNRWTCAVAAFKSVSTSAPTTLIGDWW